MNPTCHEQVLAAAKAIVLRKGVNHFTIKEVVEQMTHVGSHCAKATITNHVASRCCINAPGHRSKKCSYFERIGWGEYRIV